MGIDTAFGVAYDNSIHFEKTDEKLSAEDLDDFYSDYSGDRGRPDYEEYSEEGESSGDDDDQGGNDESGGNTNQATPAAYEQQPAYTQPAEQSAYERVLSEYPHLRDPNNNHARWAGWYLANDYGGDARYAELAISRAAQRLGIQPRISNSTPQSIHRAQQASKSKPKPQITGLTKRNLELCRRFGQDPRQVARIANLKRR